MLSHSEAQGKTETEPAQLMAVIDGMSDMVTEDRLRLTAVGSDLIQQRKTQGVACITGRGFEEPESRPDCHIKQRSYQAPSLRLDTEKCFFTSNIPFPGPQIFVKMSAEKLECPTCWCGHHAGYRAISDCSHEDEA